MRGTDWIVPSPKDQSDYMLLDFVVKCRQIYLGCGRLPVTVANQDHCMCSRGFLLTFLCHWHPGRGPHAKYISPMDFWAMKKKYYTPQNQQFAPENGCLEDDPASFWERVGPIFRGKLAVSLREGARLVAVLPNNPPPWPAKSWKMPLRIWSHRLRSAKVDDWVDDLYGNFSGGRRRGKSKSIEFWFGFENIDFRLEISSLCVWPKYIYTHTYIYIYMYIYIYIYKCIFEVMSAALSHDTWLKKNLHMFRFDVH